MRCRTMKRQVAIYRHLIIMIVIPITITHIIDATWRPQARTVWGKELLGDDKHHVAHLIAEAMGAAGLIRDIHYRRQEITEK